MTPNRRINQALNPTEKHWTKKMSLTSLFNTQLAHVSKCLLGTSDSFSFLTTSFLIESPYHKCPHATWNTFSWQYTFPYLTISFRKICRMYLFQDTVKSSNSIKISYWSMQITTLFFKPSKVSSANFHFIICIHSIHILVALQHPICLWRKKKYWNTFARISKKK